MYIKTDKNETIGLKEFLPKEWVVLNKELLFAISAYYSKLPDSKAFPKWPVRFNFFDSRIIAFHGILQYMSAPPQVSVAGGTSRLGFEDSRKDNIIVCVTIYEPENPVSVERPQSILGLLTLHLTTNLCYEKIVTRTIKALFLDDENSYASKNQVYAFKEDYYPNFSSDALKNRLSELNKKLNSLNGSEANRDLFSFNW